MSGPPESHLLLSSKAFIILEDSDPNNHRGALFSLGLVSLYAAF